jgi:uncharacterized protein (TIGR03067 family)
MFAAFVALTLAAVPQDKGKEKEWPEAAKKELKALEGKWKVVKVATSMGDAEIEAGKEVFITFKGNEMVAENGTRKDTVKITAIDASTDPKCIDLLGKRKDNTERTVEAVYKIEKDTLRLALCVPGDSKQRPTGFGKPPDDRTMVWIMKRVKE